MLKQMQDYLAEVQRQLPLTKIMTAILDLQQQIDQTKEAIKVNRDKINQIINFINGDSDAVQGDAADLNPDIEEDNAQEDQFDEYTGSAVSMGAEEDD